MELFFNFLYLVFVVWILILVLVGINWVLFFIFLILIFGLLVFKISEIGKCIFLDIFLVILNLFKCFLWFL